VKGKNNKGYVMQDNVIKIEEQFCLLVRIVFSNIFIDFLFNRPKISF